MVSGSTFLIFVFGVPRELHSGNPCLAPLLAGIHCQTLQSCWCGVRWGRGSFCDLMSTSQPGGGPVSGAVTTPPPSLR